jgi:hypothetical protein
MSVIESKMRLLVAALGLTTVSASSTLAGAFPSLRGGGLSGPRRSRQGWTPRHVQRMAQKKRNQARHRAATRGKRSRA